LNSRTTEKFRIKFEELPAEIKNLAKKSFTLWKENPYHKSLRFKQVHQNKPIYSVRIGKAWRALGVKEDETVIWFWVGSHSEYDKMIKVLNN